MRNLFLERLKELEEGRQVAEGRPWRPVLPLPRPRGSVAMEFPTALVREWPAEVEQAELTRSLLVVDARTGRAYWETQRIYRWGRT